MLDRHWALPAPSRFGRQECSAGALLILRQVIKNIAAPSFHQHCKWHTCAVLIFWGRWLCTLSSHWFRAAQNPQTLQINKALTGASCHPLSPLHSHSFGRVEGIFRCVCDKPLQRVSLTQPELITREQLPFLPFLFNRQAQPSSLQQQSGNRLWLSFK